MRSRSRTPLPWIDNEELEAQIELWKEEGKMSERLGQIMLDFHNNILKHKNFNRYPQEVKEEMRSFSIAKIVKSEMRRFDPSKAKAFSYLTRAIFLNYLTVIGKYYKRLNQHQAWLKEQFTKAAIETNSSFACRLADSWSTSSESTREDQQ